MVRIYTVAIASDLWGLLFYLALSIAKLDLGYFASCCGPWGCLAGLAPLLSVHAMWLVLIAGLSTLGKLAIPSLKNPIFWKVGTCLALLLIAVMWGYEFFRYFTKGGEFSDVLDIPKFLVFHAMRWTDIPVLEFAITCVAFVILGKLRAPKIVTSRNAPAFQTIRADFDTDTIASKS